jgi:pimeloyl-ACP methyl ester carboxylesterase
MQVNAEYLEIGGTVGFVEHRGAGPAVFCVHTAGQSGRQWRDVLTELPELGWTVFVPDLPGHGRSDLSATGPVEDIEAYARWCRGAMDALALDEVYVVGCSIGGKIAVQLAIDEPDRVCGIVAMAADGCNDVLSVQTLRRSLDDATSPSRMDRTVLGTLAAVGASVPVGRADAIAARHRCEDPIVSITHLVAWTRHDVRASAPTIGCPVQLAYGTDDFWVDAAGIAALARSIPMARCEVLPGIGHYPMEEVPGFTRVLDGWLRWLAEAGAVGS